MRSLLRSKKDYTKILTAWNNLDHHRLLKHLTVYVVIIFVVFMVGLTHLTLHSIRVNVERLYEKGVEEISYCYAMNINEFIRVVLRDLKHYTDEGIVKYGTDEQIASWFTKEKVFLPVYIADLYYCDKDGNAILSTGEKVNIKDRDCYKNIIIENHIISIDDPVVSKLNQKNVIHIAIANTSGTTSKGFFGCSILMDTLERHVKSLSIGKFGSPFIVNQSGTILVPAGTESVFSEKTVSSSVKEQEEDSVALNSFLELANSSLRGSIILNKGRKRSELVAFTSLNGTSWYLGITVPMAEVYSISTGLRYYIIGLFLVLGIVILITLVLTITVSIHKVNSRVKLEKNNILDSQTGLLTQEYFQTKTTAMLKDNPEANFMLVGIDVRGFKIINELYGTQASNEILSFMAKHIREFARQEKGIASHGYADRFFCIVRMDNEEEAIQKFVDIVFQGIKQHPKSMQQFSPKAGIVFVGKDYDNDSIEILIGKTSYAKRTIMNSLVQSYAVFNDEIKRSLIFDKQIENLVPKAFQDDEFFVVYQPKMDLKSETIVGAEALVRWNCEEKGLMQPDSFIPLFERDGYIEQLDFVVYKKVFDFIQSRIDNNELIVPISVNMSRYHHDAQKFFTQFTELLSEYNFPKELIQVEIVERDVGYGSEMLKDVTELLHSVGIEVSMDDFGSGESSLNMLSTIPVDVLKLDQHFLYKAHLSEETSRIITKVIELASSLGKIVVCEGVETEEQVDFLKSINCNQVQGYYYSKPLEENAFLAYMESNHKDEK